MYNNGSNIINMSQICGFAAVQALLFPKTSKQDGICSFMTLKCKVPLLLVIPQNFQVDKVPSTSHGFLMTLCFLLERVPSMPQCFLRIFLMSHVFPSGEGS